MTPSPSPSSGQNLGGSSAGALSAAQMREKRLEALAGGVNNNNNNNKNSYSNHAHHNYLDEAQDLQAALARSLQDVGPDFSKEEHEKQVLGRIYQSARPLDIAEFHSIMWGPTSTDSDKQRWVGQGIDTNRSTRQEAAQTSTNRLMSSRLAMLGSDHSSWGLVQEHGGPCGVLAAVQAEVLCLLLFGTRDPLDYPEETLENNTLPDGDIGEELLEQCLAMSIAVILARSAVMPPTAEKDKVHHGGMSAQLVLPNVPGDDRKSKGLEWKDLSPWYPGSSTGVASETLSVFTIEMESISPAYRLENLNTLRQAEKISRLTHWLQLFLRTKLPNSGVAPLEFFRRPGGVILLVMSLVCSRGSTVINSDMDDPSGTKLTSQFGHCGQELINLLLTGQAVSNVFDNTMTPSGALTCRGVQSRPAVGYLSQLESMRYCEVGGYYKSPKFPIWVIGSTSHFTVLFGEAACLKESQSDALLEKCRRAFKELDGEENGFISRLHLADVYKILDLNVGSEHAMQTLAASLEVNGADIILWDDFWKATSRLMTGASIESVLQGEVSAPVVSTDQPSPLLLTQYGEPQSDSKPAAMTDEEMAKRLQDEFNMETSNSQAPHSAAGTAAAVARAPSPPSVPMSDEELARKLAAEWEAEEANKPHEVDEDQSTQALADDETTTTLEDEKMTDSRMDEHKLDYEKYGETFELYHYNGMRGGTLTPFRVTRLSPEEAVGASIALGGSGGASAQSVGTGDLEDVVRTKWPSCMVNWLSNSPPYID